MKSKPKRPPYSFGFGFDQQVKASSRMDYTAANDWMDLLIRSDNARLAKNKASANALRAQADAARTRHIIKWVRRPKESRYPA